MTFLRGLRKCGVSGDAGGRRVVGARFWLIARGRIVLRLTRRGKKGTAGIRWIFLKKNPAQACWESDFVVRFPPFFPRRVSLRTIDALRKSPKPSPHHPPAPSVSGHSALPVFFLAEV